MVSVLLERRDDKLENIVSDLAGKYEWNPEERREHLRRLGDIRAGMKEEARLIRELVPMQMRSEFLPQLLYDLDTETAAMKNMDVPEDD